jgi:hypothetical protein
MYVYGEGERKGTMGGKGCYKEGRRVKERVKKRRQKQKRNKSKKKEKRGKPGWEYQILHGSNGRHELLNGNNALE